MRLPHDHPQRLALHEEVHARPSEALRTPLRVTFLALASEPSEREQEWAHVRSLAARYGVDLPETGLNHCSVDLGSFRLKWERHSEFARYKFIVAGLGDAPFATPAIDVVPQDWLAGLTGKVMVAAHVALARAPEQPLGHDAMSAELFDGNIVVGANIADGAGAAYTDFHLHDGFSRVLIEDRSMSARQAGRMVQRLLEIETYRMMALLALPVAQQLAPFLGATEHELSEITTVLAEATEADE
ncbi:MAG: DUF3422 family protein, partial [Steroidobacteraceae bacterium]